MTIKDRINPTIKDRINTAQGMTNKKDIEVKTLNYITFKSKEALINFVLGVRRDSDLHIMAGWQPEVHGDIFHMFLNARVNELLIQNEAAGQMAQTEAKKAAPIPIALVGGISNQQWAGEGISAKAAMEQTQAEGAALAAKVLGAKSA